MSRDLVKDVEERNRRDKINTERLDTTRKRVAHAFRILNHWRWENLDGSSLKTASNESCETLSAEVAHAVNLLEAASREMDWHCQWFGYDNLICEELDDACSDFGSALAQSYEEDSDIALAQCDIRSGLVKLAKALATLVRWDDETQDVSEI